MKIWRRTRRVVMITKVFISHKKEDSFSAEQVA